MNHERFLNSINVGKQAYLAKFREDPKFLICADQAYKILKKSVDTISGLESGRLTTVLGMKIVTTCELESSTKDAITYRLSSLPISSSHSRSMDIEVRRFSVFDHFSDLSL